MKRFSAGFSGARLGHSLLGRVPTPFNNDRGCQFTGLEFKRILKAHDIQIA
jgi:hypothetical protein